MVDGMICGVLVHLFALMSTVLAIPECSKLDPTTRTDCGFPGITQEQCLQNNCCFDGSSTNAPTCYRPRGTTTVCHQFCDIAGQKIFSAAFSSCFANRPRTIEAQVVESDTCPGIFNIRVVDTHRWGFQVFIERFNPGPCTDLEVSWTASFSCPTDFKLKFTEGNTALNPSYAQYMRPVPALRRATVCALIQSNLTQFSIISCYPANGIEMILFISENTVNLFLNSRIKSVAINPIWTTTLTHICASFDSDTRNVNLYVNGRDVPLDFNLYDGDTIPTNQDFLVGQFQEDGNFRASYHFEGTISNVVVFDRVLSVAEINSLNQDCYCPTDFVVGLTANNTQLIGSHVQIIPSINC